MSKKTTFVPTYENEEVTISEQTYSEDSHRHGDKFLSVQSGGLTVHGDDISLERNTLWVYDSGKIVVSIYVDDSDMKEIRETFGGYL